MRLGDNDRANRKNVKFQDIFERTVVFTDHVPLVHQLAGRREDPDGGSAVDVQAPRRVPSDQSRVIELICSAQGTSVFTNGACQSCAGTEKVREHLEKKPTGSVRKVM